jgi:2-polyprenyl-3-methyl-5-hydroxy-6-metoxy-1,4-benzoquinol methylase
MKCKICNHDSNNECLYPKEMVFGTREIFAYIYCSNCLSLSIRDIPEDIHKYYQNYPNLKFFKYKETLFRRLLKNYLLKKSNFLSRKLGYFLKEYNDLAIKSLSPFKFPISTSILDVGCGSGLFVYELKNFGFKNIIGIDPYLDHDITFDNGGKIFRKSLFEVNEKFDLITFHHSLEHMQNLVKVAKKIDEILNPGGMCIIRIPNIESESFKHFKHHWEGIHPPFHFFLPSRKGFELIFENTHLRIASCHGEQLLELFLLSASRVMDIADFEPLGVRKCLNDKRLKNQNLPSFTKNEIKHWKEKRIQVIKNKTTDYIAYYLIKDHKQ